MNNNEPEDLSVDTNTFLTLPNVQHSPVAPESNFSLSGFLHIICEQFQYQQRMLLQQQSQQQILQSQLQEERFGLPDSKEIERLIRRAIYHNLPNKNSHVAIQGELKVTIDSGAPVTVKISTPTLSPSKRKSYHPIRICPANPMSPGCGSTDSGALDLSRAGSVVSNESAPVTPLKLEVATMINGCFENRSAPGRMVSSPKRRFTGGRRAFSCNQCGEMEFRSLQHLETHTMEVHGGYRCHVCGSKFTQRSNLQRHALKHVGFKPFQCRICKHGYYRKDHLMRHMEVLHPTFNARENIEVFLTSSQSLDYLNTNQAIEKSSPPGVEQPQKPETEEKTEEPNNPLP
ncbi:hypothetical protein Aperf_G00000024291 [Anoplocephala perfoliata]